MAFAVTLLFLIFRLSFIESGDVEYLTVTVVIKVDCSTYLPGLNEDLYREALKRILELNEVPEEYIHLESMHVSDGVCAIKVRVQGNPRDFRDVITWAVTEAYGQSWGCRQDIMNVPVTSYYTAKIIVPDISSMGLSTKLIRRCEVEILKWSAPIEVLCNMNEYGGYYWKLGERSQCLISEFDNLPLEKVEDLKKSPFYCQLKLFITIGTFLQHTSEMSCRLLPILNDFHKKCSNPERWVYESAYREWFSLIDATLFVMESARKCSGYAVYATKVAKRLFQTMLIPILNYFDVYEQSTYHRSQRVEFYTFHQVPQGRQSKCGNYLIYTKSVNYPLLVGCFDMPFEEEGERLSLFPFFSVGFIFIREVHPSKNFRVYVQFTIPNFHQRGQYNCSSSWGGEYSWNMFHQCRVTLASKDNAICECNRSGLIALWQYPAPRKRNKFLHNNLNGFLMKILIYLDILAHVIGILWQLLVRLRPKNPWLDFSSLLNDMSLIPLIDMDILRTLINTVILMMHRYNINPVNEEKCMLTGPIWNALILAATYMDIFILLLIIIAPRDERLLNRFWQFVLVPHAAGILTFLGLYNSSSLDYFNVNCYPNKFAQTFVYPQLVLIGVAGVICIVYRVLKPRFYYFHWKAMCLNLGFATAIWATQIKGKPPSIKVTVRLRTLTLLYLIYTFLMLIYYSLLKMSFFRDWFKRLLSYLKLKKIIEVLHTLKRRVPTEKLYIPHPDLFIQQPMVEVDESVPTAMGESVPTEISKSDQTPEKISTESDAEEVYSFKVEKPQPIERRRRQTVAMLPEIRGTLTARELRMLRSSARKSRTMSYPGRRTISQHVGRTSSRSSKSSFTAGSRRLTERSAR